jgi:hypothetical protein
VAPEVVITGSIFVGTGTGAIFATTLTLTGTLDRPLGTPPDPTDPTTIPPNQINAYDLKQWNALSPEQVFLFGGSGAGGAGGDGQIIPEPSTTMAGVALLIVLLGAARRGVSLGP